MKKGQKVKIYQKPLSEEDYEGEAILMKKFCFNESEKTEDWYVKFIGDYGTYLRKILIKKN